MQLYVVGLILVSVGAQVSASNCDAIVNHGMRNIEITESSKSVQSLKYLNHCQKDFASMSDTELVHVEAEIYGQGKGSGDYSRNKRAESLRQWCTTNQAAAQSASSATAQSITFYQGAVSAWESCNKLYSKDIKINPVISPDAKTVDIGISYSGATASGVILMGIIAQNFQCSSVSPLDAKPVKFPVEVDNLNIQIHCDREGVQKIQKNGEEYDFLDRGTITIQSSSDPFQLFFAEEWNPGLPAKAALALRQDLLGEIQKNEIPTGTVITSVLGPEQFFAANHPQYQLGEWVEATGGKLPKNSAYERLTGKGSAPDLSYLKASRALVEVATGDLLHGDSIDSVENARAKNFPVTWEWIVSARDVQGQGVNSDSEQDVDQFQTLLDASGQITARGRTLNRKIPGWGAWQSGSVNFLGIGSHNNRELHYYIKVN